ncbi:MAG: type I phosphomannose isomerase catalytic subunit [bacterium]
MPNQDIFALEPVFKHRIWGGNAIHQIFGSGVPEGAVGEAWLISAIPGSESIVKDGPFAGRTVSEFYHHEAEFFGQAEAAFPLLVKIIDAADRLSVQVHPDDAYAQSNENQSGKNECWYIMAAEPGAELVVGHGAMSRQELKAAAVSGELEHLLTRIPVTKGDFVYIPAGTIHAIGKGIVILETQQSSDVTYRIYDYNRRDAAGQPRQLHLEQGIAVTDIPAKPIEIHHFANGFGIAKMIATPFFMVEKWSVSGSIRYHNLHHRWMLAAVVEGEATLNRRFVKKGDALIIAATVNEINVIGHAELIVTYVAEAKR